MGIGSIGKYERLDVLGHGTSGVVYLAWDKLLRRQVALKEIRAAGPELERVLEEARVLDRLGHHSHIVRIHGVDHVEGVILIDMELVRGRNLAEVLRDRQGQPMPPKEAVRITLDVLDALIYAHERRIIHRDVKPANILIGADGTVKLTDFGLAEALGTGSVAGGGGTYPYMAPEDFSEDADSDYRSDLWAMGVVLYEMLTGVRPFQVTGRTKDPFAWKRVIEQTEAPRLSTLRPELPLSLEDILRRALTKDKVGRFATAHLFADSLRAAAKDLVGSAPLPEPEILYTPPATASREPSLDDPQGEGEPVFVFGGGQTVCRTLDELLAGCAKHWDEARRALADRRIERFLHTIGEVYIAELAHDLALRTNENEDRRLREFLERSRAEEEEDLATLPVSLMGRPGSVRQRRRFLRRPSPAENGAAAVPPGPFGPALSAPHPPQVVIPAPSPPPVSVPSEKEQRRREKERRREEERQEQHRRQEQAQAAARAAAQKAHEEASRVADRAGMRWWFWPLYLLVVAPPAMALLTRGNMSRNSQGMLSDPLEAWAITGILSGMLLLVGVGARVPLSARVACAVPLAGGIIALGALCSSALSTNPSPQALLQVAVALLIPLCVLICQAFSAHRLWRMWAWIVFLIAGMATFTYLQR